MQPQIVYLDDSQELVELLTDYLEISLGTICRGYTSFQEFQNDLPTILQTKVAILDLELGFNQPNGIDAYELLKQNQYNGKVFFLTGHGRNHPLVQKAKASGIVIWEKPMDGVQISETIREVLPPFPSMSRNPKSEKRLKF